MKIKVCPICGKEFPCYADDDGRTCWCESFLEVIIEEGSDCICPDCLAKKALDSSNSQ
ncbi:MAG: cysteine-rich CWC family protein [Candidatus Cloacimonetes bacterium]|nr:cysteine-rich CWC family protein [Candidatus Cloacimonadota bacterium]